MRFHSVATVFFLISILDVKNVYARNVPIWKYPGMKGTKLKDGCHTFFGKVECGDQRKPLPNAIVTVWDYDTFDGDDKLWTSDIDADGNYKIMGCAHDNYGSHVELYLDFNDVCFNGQHFLVPFPKPNVFQTFSGAEINNEMIWDDTLYTDYDSNHSLPEYRHYRRSKYHPMSRPYTDDNEYPPQPHPQHRRRPDQQQNNRFMDAQDGYNVSGVGDEILWVDFYLLFQNVCWIGDSYRYEYIISVEYMNLRLNSNGNVERI